MTDITKILRAEISRLARKEVRSEIDSLSQSSTNWETGKARPRPAQLQGLIAVRGLSRREADARLAEL
jgi:hypothetical protein